MPELSRYVNSASVVGPFALKVRFEDETEQIIHFEPVLRGQLYGPWRDSKLFNQVRVPATTATTALPHTF